MDARLVGRGDPSCAWQRGARAAQGQLRRRRRRWWRRRHGWRGLARGARRPRRGRGASLCRHPRRRRRHPIRGSRSAPARADVSPRLVARRDRGPGECDRRLRLRRRRRGPGGAASTAIGRAAPGRRCRRPQRHRRRHGAGNADDGTRGARLRHHLHAAPARGRAPARQQHRRGPGRPLACRARARRALSRGGRRQGLGDGGRRRRRSAASQRHRQCRARERGHGRRARGLDRRPLGQRGGCLGVRRRDPGRDRARRRGRARSSRCDPSRRPD